MVEVENDHKGLKLHGACQYLRKFIQNFIIHVVPLQSLTKAYQKLEWCFVNLFFLLKRKISEAPVLALLNLQRFFKLEATTSRYAMGAFFVQDNRPETC